MNLVHTWYERTCLAREYPCDLSSQRISLLLEDITTTASYSGNSTFEYGHAKDHGDLPQVNLSLIMERRRSLPILFEIYPGSIVDVSTLRITVERIRNLIAGVVIILDCSFFSLDNLKMLHKHEYIIAATYSRKEVKHVFSAGMRRVDSADNTILYGGRRIFAMHVDFSMADLDMGGYLYHDLDLEAREGTGFHRHIREVMDAVEKTEPKEQNEHNYAIEVEKRDLRNCEVA